MTWWQWLLLIFICLNVFYLFTEFLSWSVQKLTGKSIKERLRTWLGSKGVPIVGNKEE